MSATEPLTGARIPTQSDGPLGGLQIANAISDIADETTPYFTSASARDTAYSAWVANGHSMRNGLQCFVSGIGRMMYLSSGWFPLDGYYAEGSGTGMTLTATPTAPSWTATQSLPAGTYDLNVKARFALSVNSAEREVSLHIYNGSTALFTTGFQVAPGVGSRNHSDFTRLTLASAATLSLRASADATGGTQFISSNALRARRVA